MTTRSTNGKGDAPTEDPWAESLEPTRNPMWTKAATMLQGLPGEFDGAGETMTEAMRAVSSSVSSAPDDTLLVGASVASGLAIGLLLGSAPRILAMGAVIAAVSLGATLVQRHPAHRRASFGRPVMA